MDRVWLIDWSLDWRSCRSIHRLIGPLIDRLIEGVVVRFIDWLVPRLIDWLVITRNFVFQLSRMMPPVILMLHHQQWLKVGFLSPHSSFIFTFFLTRNLFSKHESKPYSETEDPRLAAGTSIPSGIPSGTRSSPSAAPSGVKSVAGSKTGSFFYIFNRMGMRECGVKILKFANCLQKCWARVHRPPVNRAPEYRPLRPRLSPLREWNRLESVRWF